MSARTTGARLAALVAVVGITVAALATTAAAAPPGPQVVAGTHVLLQVPGGVHQSKAVALNMLNRSRPAIVSALNRPGVTAFAVRVPWEDLETASGALDPDILEAAKAIADSTGDELTVRFMAGRHTPARVLDAPGVATLGSGDSRFPSPVLADGSPNEPFIAEWGAFVGRLANWSRANGVHLLHLSHFANQWAEFYYGPEVQAVASRAEFVAATNRLVDVAAPYLGDGLWGELPLSGHGPLMRFRANGAPGISEQVADHIVDTFGPRSGFFIQANGLDADGIWGAGSESTEQLMDYVLDDPVLVGTQMIQPQQYPWPQVYAQAIEAGSTYVEVYLPSFSGWGATTLLVEAAAFAVS